MLHHPIGILLLQLCHDYHPIAGLASKDRMVVHSTMLEGVLPGVADVGAYVILIP